MLALANIATRMDRASGTRCPLSIFLYGAKPDLSLTRRVEGVHARLATDITGKGSSVIRLPIGA